MASSSVFLCESDIPGASLLGRKPEELKNDELKFWLKCRDVAKGLKTKAQLVKRVYDYINSGKDKEIVDPDKHKIYSRRKQRLAYLPDTHADTECNLQFPSDGWGHSLEKMPVFSKAEMNDHVAKSGKNFGNKDNHSVPTNLRKGKRFLDDEYLQEIESTSNDKYFFFRAKCSHSFRKNDPPHTLKIGLCIISGKVIKCVCSCVAGRVGFCNHVLALMFKICKFYMNDCQSTMDLTQEDDQQPITSSTSLLQKWHKKGGGSNISPEPVLEVLVKKTKMDGDVSKSCGKPLLYEARAEPSHSDAAERTLKEEFSKINPNCGFAQMFSDNFDRNGAQETKFGSFKAGSTLVHQLGFTEANFEAAADINSIPRALVATNVVSYPAFTKSQIEMVVPHDLTINEQSVLNKVKISEAEIDRLEKETRQQANTPLWKDERKFRFTASNFHLISKRQRNHDTLASNLIHPKDVYTRNFEHGKKYEPIALNAYEKFMYNRNTPVQVLNCGLVIDQGFPILGATPDAKVLDHGCIHPYGIAEVKCPITKFNVSPLDACTYMNFFMEKFGDNTCFLKENHPYYAQVQGQLGITGAKWCDFIVYTKVGLYVQRIPVNVQFWEQLKSKLHQYYFGHFIKHAASVLASDSSTE